jgi:hypothetical protein
MRRAAIIAVACVAAGVSSAQQAKDPDIAYIYPAGGRAGESFDVTVGGQQLSQITGARVTGGGVVVSVTGFSRPLPGKRFQEFRETLANRRDDMMGMTPKGKKPGDEAIGPILQEAGASEEEIRLFLIMRKQKNDPKRQDNRQLEESVSLRIEIAPDAVPGPRSLRLLGKNGISNPLPFAVGTHPEVREPPSTDPSPPAPLPLKFPLVINGQILPGEADRYRFRAAAGDRLVFVGQARALIPYLADAVPGWFQMALTVFNSAGSVLADARSFRFSPDPVLVFDVKESGHYELEVRDALYRGREDFIYRITAGKIPFVAGIAPLGAPAGSSAEVEIFGWNLARNRARIAVPTTPGSFSRFLAESPETVFEAGDGAEITASEPDEDLSRAVPVPLPVTINGRIGRPGDEDVFAVRATRGSPLVVEVFARRLGSPLDAFVRITDSAGREVARGDDQEDIACGLLTHHADSRVLFDPPADGICHIRITDAQNSGGPDFPYRLRIGPPRPDFRLRIAPSGLSGSPGANVPITVRALRKDGFQGEIRLACGTPGFTLAGGRIPAGADSVTATLAFPAKPDPEPREIVIVGGGDTPGGLVTRQAEPTDDLLQAFFFHHLVPAEELLAFTPPDAPKRPPLGVLPDSVTISANRPATVTASAPKNLTKGLRASLVNPPDGITIASATPTKSGFAIAFAADPSKIRPPAAGNLLVELTASVPDKKDPSKTNSWSLGFLPAIPFEIAEDG